jgi:hypothetical protein
MLSNNVILPPKDPFPSLLPESISEKIDMLTFNDQCCPSRYLYQKQHANSVRPCNLSVTNHTLTRQPTHIIINQDLNPLAPQYVKILQPHIPSLSNRTFISVCVTRTGFRDQSIRTTTIVFSWDPSHFLTGKF